MMNRITAHILSGLICILVGTGLVLFAGDVETPIITLSKLGVVLLVIGGLDLVYGAYLAVTNKK